MITATLEALAGLSLRTKIESAVVVLAVAGGALWHYTRPPVPVPEVLVAAPEQKQDDGSTVVRRAPDAHPAPPPHIIPKGFHEESREQLTVAPSPAAAASGCPPVRVALSVISDDHQHRVVASSPDGQIVDAVDIPIVAPLVMPPPLKWAAGLSYTTQRETGIWLERDVGRLRLGVEVAKGTGSPRVEVRLGVAF